MATFKEALTAADLMHDEQDRWAFEAFTWRFHRARHSTYARAHAFWGHYFYFHRVILRPAAGLVVDHINGNGLDNRRVNLRVCTRAQNNIHRTRFRSDNHTGYPGVHPISNSPGRWFARVTLDGRIIHLGCFSSFEEAKAARIAGEVRYFGAFAPMYEEVNS